MATRLVRGLGAARQLHDPTGQGYARSREAVLWIDRAEATERRQHKVIAYLEGDVEVVLDRRPGAPRLTDQTWLGRFFSSAGVQVRAATTAGKPDMLPPIYWRGMERRSPESADSGWRARGAAGAIHGPRAGAAAAAGDACPPPRRHRRRCRRQRRAVRRRAGAGAGSGDERAAADARRRAADSRLSPQRRARASRVAAPIRPATSGSP